jgi:hypothetical protein
MLFSLIHERKESQHRDVLCDPAFACIRLPAMPGTKGAGDV